MGQDFSVSDGGGQWGEQGTMRMNSFQSKGQRQVLRIACPSVWFHDRGEVRAGLHWWVLLTVQGCIFNGPRTCWGQHWTADRERKEPVQVRLAILWSTGHRKTTVSRMLPLVRCWFPRQPHAQERVVRLSAADTIPTPKAGDGDQDSRQWDSEGAPRTAQETDPGRSLSSPFEDQGQPTTLVLGFLIQLCLEEVDIVVYL